MFDSLFRELENTESNIKFKYFFLFILTLIFFSYLDIQLNIVFAFLIVILVIIYFNYRQVEKKIIEEEKYNTKLEEIRPELNHITEKEKHIINYLFSIQEFYYYNPPAYEELIDNIDKFFELYYESKDFRNKSGLNYTLCKKHKYNSLNTLQSIIYNLPDNKDVIKKLDNAISELDKILTVYLDDLELNNTYEILESGLHNKSVLINKGPKEANYDNENSNKYSYNVL
jgi:Ca2+/Na+ antiporter